MLNALSVANISLKIKPSKLNLKTKLLNHFFVLNDLISFLRNISQVIRNKFPILYIH